MALKGNLKDFSLADIFQLVALSRKTGVLNIVRSDGSGHVYFHDGLVSYVKSSWREDSYLQRLIRSGKVKEKDLPRVQEIQKAAGEGQNISQTLVSEKIVESETVEKFYQDQIFSGIFELFTWEEGDFNFDSGKTVAEENIGLSVDVQTIVTEINKRLEEWNKIKKKISSSEMIFIMSPSPGDGNLEISLKPREWKLLCFLNGIRDVRALASDLGMSEFEISKLLYGMLSVGLVEIIEKPLEAKPAEKPAAKPAEKIEVKVEEKIEEKVEEKAGPVKVVEEIGEEAAVAKPSVTSAPEVKEKPETPKEGPKVEELEEAIKKRADQVVEEITAKITQQLLGRKPETATSAEAQAEKTAEAKATEVKKVEAAPETEIEVKEEVAVEELEDMLEELTALTGGGEGKREASVGSDAKQEEGKPAVEVKIAGDQAISRNLILKIIKGIKRL